MYKDICNGKRSEEHHPHSPDVYERETSDSGFSKGWGMHFPPAEKYWFEVHTHYRVEKAEDLPAAIGRFQSEVLPFNVKRLITMPPILHSGSDGKYIHSSAFSVLDENPHFDVRFENENVLRMIYLNYLQPDADFVELAIKKGICGLKLHNAPLICDGADKDVWLSEKWGRVFEILEENGIPVLWHVTQRLTTSLYTGGGSCTYWKDGWEKGVTYTNEDLLQVFLKIVERYPGISFISAHQLHLGWDRLSDLFDRYGNLYTDTSVGCYIKKDDQMYEEDREYLRDIFVRYSDRILFATDSFIAENSSGVSDAYSGNIRFIKQLRLPYDALQRISHENAERLFAYRCKGEAQTGAG